ncbi:MAG TPA: 3-oxoacyl-[acyl-carrier-protein] synthase III C-terminal domain-containing protein [Gemmatimonadaceae bacterium]|nr:3-oxoacyl-[acyl-carrier-protein] synthase III C-terminal domain-containing protein [Gemmatimonadaceae bacterium]
MPRYDTAALLRASRPDDAERCLTSAVSRRLIAELGVEHRHLTHVPGTPPATGRLTAFDLARSAVLRMQARRANELAHLDALIFVSTSNPNPCNSQAALLAGELGLSGSCMDLKAGCSSGVLGLVQAALLIQAGCGRVLVVMAENLSQFTPAEDLRMLLTVGDGAACVLLERAAGAGFSVMVHGTRAEFAGAMSVRTPFPPASPEARYVYEFGDTRDTAAFLRAQWHAVFDECLSLAGIERADLAYALVHQTHVAQVSALAADLGLGPERMPMVVDALGNMGTPTFAVALARAHASLLPGQRYLLQAVGGGVSWCGIVGEHVS